MRPRLTVRDGFLVLMAALWCVDETGVLPVFLFAAAVHEAGHLLVLYGSGGRLRELTLTCCGAVLRCTLPVGRYARAAVCLAGPAASFALTAGAGACGMERLAGASALLGLFNLLPLPPLDGGMAVAHLADDRLPRLRTALAVAAAVLLLSAGFFLRQRGGGCWLLLIGGLVCWQHGQQLAKSAGIV